MTANKIICNYKIIDSKLFLKSRRKKELVQICHWHKIFSIIVDYKIFGEQHFLVAIAKNIFDKIDKDIRITLIPDDETTKRFNDNQNIGSSLGIFSKVDYEVTTNLKTKSNLSLKNTKITRKSLNK